jgi:hypothetical protein
MRAVAQRHSLRQSGIDSIKHGGAPLRSLTCAVLPYRQ